MKGLTELHGGSVEGRGPSLGRVSELRIHLRAHWLSLFAPPQSRRVRPDIAILDVGMPQLNGYEVARKKPLRRVGSPFEARGSDRLGS